MDIHSRRRIIRRSITTPRQASASSTVTLTTEQPIRRFVAVRGEWVPEILLMSGVKFRQRRQVCVLDSGNRGTVKAVVGSVRRLRIEGDALVGDLLWARDEFSQSVKAKYLDGDLQRFTVGIQEIESAYLPTGKTLRTRSGVVSGPANIVTRWTPLDASLGVRE